MRKKRKDLVGEWGWMCRKEGGRWAGRVMRVKEEEGRTGREDDWLE